VPNEAIKLTINEIKVSVFQNLMVVNIMTAELVLKSVLVNGLISSN
jgi:hypothetical protein